MTSLALEPFKLKLTTRPPKTLPLSSSTVRFCRIKPETRHRSLRKPSRLDLIMNVRTVLSETTKAKKREGCAGDIVISLEIG